MPIHKFLTTDKLVEYLDYESRELLLSQGLHDIGNYGWLSEDKEDPEYIGHAIWQTSPPVETEWEYLFGDGPVMHRPTERERLLTIAGSDFEGLMRTSRLSIGLCLLHQLTALKRVFDDNHYFWLHHTDSILHLNMASDRIREYFVVAFFNETSETYKKKGKKNGWYVTPFIEARDYAKKNKVNADILDSIVELPNMAEQIYLFRESRNDLVHEISTKLGERYKELIENQQRAFDSKYVPDTMKNYEEVLQRHEEIIAEHKEELSEASVLIIDWYKILVKFSSHVFESEYRLRV